eukprot:7765671-Pyramimonas_sp.AAC.1
MSAPTGSGPQLGVGPNWQGAGAYSAGSRLQLVSRPQLRGGGTMEGRQTGRQADRQASRQEQTHTLNIDTYAYILETSCALRARSSSS